MQNELKTCPDCGTTESMYHSAQDVGPLEVTYSWRCNECGSTWRMDFQRVAECQTDHRPRMFQSWDMRDHTIHVCWMKRNGNGSIEILSESWEGYRTHWKRIFTGSRYNHRTREYEYNHFAVKQNLKDGRIMTQDGDLALISYYVNNQDQMPRLKLWGPYVKQYWLEEKEKARNQKKGKKNEKPKEQEG